MIDFTVEQQFTETYRRYQHHPPAIREAVCLRAQFPGYLRPIEEGDLLAGRIAYGAVGFSPQEGGIGLGYYLKAGDFERALQQPDLPEAERTRIQDMLDFWRTEATAAKVRAAFTPELQRALPTDDWSTEPGIAYPIYRALGGCLDFDRLLRTGLPGLKEEITAACAEHVADPEAVALYDAMQVALDTVADCCRWYADQAEAIGTTCVIPERHAYLLTLADSLRHIAVAKPATFLEAAQLAWLYALLSGHRNYGRLDEYLGDFYAADLAAGRITEEQALAILGSLWNLIWARHLIFDGRVIVGGMGRRNPENADLVALLAIEATRRHLATEPQLTLRFYRGQNPRLLSKALTVIGEGRTYPLLYNDDVNVPAVMRAYDIPRQDAQQYMPFSCGEYALDHRSYGSPNAVMNLLQALQAALHNGRDPLTGKLTGLQTGELSSFTSFEQLLAAYMAQVEFYVRVMADFEQLQYDVAGREAPFLLTAILYDNCIARGRGIFSGGIKYLGATIETYGNTNTADSLTAIKRLVYDEEKLTLEQLVAACDANFEGYLLERKWMQNAPKYGNDMSEADSMAVSVHNHVCEYIRSQRQRTRLHSCLAVIINNSANTYQGQLTAASPDGRMAREPMANANNPAPGADRKGLTAMLNSLVKLDPGIHAGAVQNMKLSREMFTTKREHTEYLLDTYFEQGGSQAMITVVNRGDLEAALREPDKYQHIFVRVGGFSARFVRLEPAVQQEILNRTLY